MDRSEAINVVLRAATAWADDTVSPREADQVYTAVEELKRPNF